MSDTQPTNEINFGMDVGIDLDKITRVYLNHPTTGEPLLDDKGNPFWLDVRSALSDGVKRKLHAIQGKYQAKRMKNRGGARGRLTYEQEQSLYAEIYSCPIVDWHIGAKPGGPALAIECTTENARKWCEGNPLFRDQIANGSDDLDNYAKDVEGNFTSET